jgi:hypothetical protein
LTKLVNTASNANLLKLLTGIAIARAATCLVAVQAVGTIGILGGTGLGKGDLACPANGKAAIVANIKVGASDLSSVRVEEGRVHVRGKASGGEDAEKRDDLSGKLHVCVWFGMCNYNYDVSMEVVLGGGT